MQTTQDTSDGLLSLGENVKRVGELSGAPRQGQYNERTISQGGEASLFSSRVSIMTFSAGSISAATTVKSVVVFLTCGRQLGGNLKCWPITPKIQHSRCVIYVCINLELQTVSRLRPRFQFALPSTVSLPV